MNVFLLICSAPYDYDTIHGIYSSRENAEVAQKTDRYTNGADIKELELDTTYAGSGGFSYVGGV